jgi:hypothetical protein
MPEADKPGMITKSKSKLLLSQKPKANITIVCHAGRFNPTLKAASMKPPDSLYITFSLTNSFGKKYEVFFQNI